MLDSLIFAFVTLALWAGIALTIAALWRAVKAGLSRSPGHWTSIVLQLGVGLGLIAWGSISMSRPPGSLVAIPIVWFVLPVSAWLAVLMAALAVRGLFIVVTRSAPRRDWMPRVLPWLVASLVLSVIWVQSGLEFAILKGWLKLGPRDILILASSLIAAFVFGLLAGRGRKASGMVRSVLVHFALLAGSIVFGLPFVWMLITSFKEDVDMASQDGLIWVPRVTKTVPILDPDNSIVEAEFEGQTVQGQIVERRPDGSALIDISRPLIMSGMTFVAKPPLKYVPKDAPVVEFEYQGQRAEGVVIKEFESGERIVRIEKPAELMGREVRAMSTELEKVRTPGLRWQNYTMALEYLPLETQRGLVYFRNSLLLVVLTVTGTLLSSSLVAYAFARMRFPLKGLLFTLLLSTMMLPAAVTMLPTFLVFRSLGWVDTLLPLWVPAFLGSAINIFLLRQFFSTIPMELEDAAKIDGCSPIRTYWQIMLPQVKPALAFIGVSTTLATWNNFMGPLVYVNSPEKMPIAYALQLFQSDRAEDPGLLMAFAVMGMAPILLLFFFAQRYFIEGVSLSGLGGR